MAFGPIWTCSALWFKVDSRINEARALCSSSAVFCYMSFCLFKKYGLWWLGGNLEAIFLLSWQLPWKRHPGAPPSLKGWCVEWRNRNTGKGDAGSLGSVTVVVICKFWTRAAFMALLAEQRDWVTEHKCPPRRCSEMPSVQRNGYGNDPVSK